MRAVWTKDSFMALVANYGQQFGLLQTMDSWGKLKLKNIVAL
jgi:hypothetical protein